MKKNNKNIGNWGEIEACRYLKRKKYKIINRNYRNYFGELDIVVLPPPHRNIFAKKKDKIIFVEVKTRTNKEFGEPEEAVNFHKQQKLIKVAEQYIKENNIKLDYQIDVISIEKDDLAQKFYVKHIPNAVSYF